MPRRPLRQGLLASLTILLVVPVVLAMTLGTAAFLAAVGDATAAAACRWVAVGLGIVWAASIVSTAILTALVSLADGVHKPTRRSRRGRRDRLEGERNETRTG